MSDFAFDRLTVWMSGLVTVEMLGFHLDVVLDSTSDFVSAGMLDLSLAVVLDLLWDSLTSVSMSDFVFDPAMVQLLGFVLVDPLDSTLGSLM